MNLKESKEKLANALGDDMKTYLEYLRLWFRQKVSREEFESRTRRLLKHQHLLRLHNEFILDLLAECQNFSSTKPLSAWTHATTSSASYSTTSSYPTKRRKVEQAVPFEPYPSPADSLMHVEFRKTSGKPQSMTEPLSASKFPSYCSNDLMLPDVSLVAGRARITAWLHGLSDGASDDACQMIVMGCNHLLKRLITGAVMSTGSALYRRSGTSDPNAGPFGRPISLKPYAPWPGRVFDAVYPELNRANFSIENTTALLSLANYREVVEAQEAYLLAFAGRDDQLVRRHGEFEQQQQQQQDKNTLTVERLKKALHLVYLDLNLPSNFHARCLVRINAGSIGS